MPTLRQYAALVTHLGPGWLFFRIAYIVRRRAGLLRRATPAIPWAALPAPGMRLASVVPVVAIGPDCVAEADAVLGGSFRLFSHRVTTAGVTPDWHRNQLTGDLASADRHWAQLGDFAFGDIKGVWELSRFPWAFTLARAHVRTGDVRYAEAFWRLLKDWLTRNPPNLGPNWMCGQEATFRLMAAIFSAETLGVPEPDRPALARLIVATGRRIAGNLNYALSQKNNHGVSECIGLITAALALPDHPESAGWRARGLRQLRRQLAELVYEDGGFAQHSLIYHRVLLHDLCWCHRRLELADQGIPLWLKAAGQRALSFLMTITDPDTGQAPLYGSNDGANVLPLADANFLDMRPVIQMASAIFNSELPLPSGSWDEAAAWLRPDWAALPRVPWPRTTARWHAPEAGCFQLTHGHDKLFFRCPTRFRHRPSHSDMLHVDVWCDGRPIALDGGSFSYNSNERFAALSVAAQHNVLTVDHLEPLKKFSRFLYLPWPLGEASEVGEETFRASHDGYKALGIRWTRMISRRTHGAGITVRDKVIGAKGRALQWHWRLADLPWKMHESGDRCATLNYQISWAGLPNARAKLLRSDAITARGWWSPYYGSVEPASALLIEADAKADIELVTEFQSLS